MNITEADYQQLQAKIDDDAKAQIAKIEEERLQNHQALNRIRAMIRKTDAPPQPQDTLFTPTSISGNGSDERANFAMKGAIRKIIRDLGGQITQPLLYRELTQRHGSSIRHRNQQHVKGQIAGILGKMADSEPPELKVVKVSTGRDPKVYRATDDLK